MLLLCFSSLRSETRLYGLASLGETPSSTASDMVASDIFFQTGISLEYSRKHVTPFAKTIGGYLDRGLFLEQYLGLQLGYNVRRFKPAITSGVGIQSVNEGHYDENEEFQTQRKLLPIFGLGLRLDAWERIYLEWDSRFLGYPWWKLELGMRIF